jgi:carboxyl-terminal processing protease
MTRLRLVFLSISLLVVVSFAGLLMAARGEGEELFRALGNLAEVVHLVETEYVDELNREALVLSLDAGIVESIDPWAAVVPADRTDEWEQALDAPPAFGLVLASRLGSAAVRAVLDGSPARDAGLDTWEVIERIDGVYTRGRPMWQVRLELAAHERDGEDVLLTVVDRQVDERREVTLRARPWEPSPVDVEVSDDVQVVHVRGLPKGTAARLVEMLDPSKPVVLDLRDLVWGQDLEAVEVADLFASDGVLAQWSGRRAGSQTYTATPDVRDRDVPVIVIGAQTEGPGEILAAALQRVGSASVGGATVGHAPYMQFVASGDLALWIPVGRWQRPDGEAIHRNGVEPDEVIDLDPDVEEGGSDTALERAIELAKPVASAEAARAA